MLLFHVVNKHDRASSSHVDVLVQGPFAVRSDAAVRIMPHDPSLFQGDMGPYASVTATLPVAPTSCETRDLAASGKARRITGQGALAAVKRMFARRSSASRRTSDSRPPAPDSQQAAAAEQPAAPQPDISSRVAAVAAADVPPAPVAAKPHADPARGSAAPLAASLTAMHSVRTSDCSSKLAALRSSVATMSPAQQSASVRLHCELASARAGSVRLGGISVDLTTAQAPPATAASVATACHAASASAPVPTAHKPTSRPSSPSKPSAIGSLRLPPGSNPSTVALQGSAYAAPLFAHVGPRRPAAPASVQPQPQCANAATSASVERWLESAPGSLAAFSTVPSTPRASRGASTNELLLLSPDPGTQVQPDDEALAAPQQAITVPQTSKAGQEAPEPLQRSGSSEERRSTFNVSLPKPPTLPPSTSEQLPARQRAAQAQPAAVARSMMQPTAGPNPTANITSLAQSEQAASAFCKDPRPSAAHSRSSPPFRERQACCDLLPQRSDSDELDFNLYNPAYERNSTQLVTQQRPVASEPAPAERKGRRAASIAERALSHSVAQAAESYGVTQEQVLQQLLSGAASGQCADEVLPVAAEQLLARSRGASLAGEGTAPCSHDKDASPVASNPPRGPKPASRRTSQWGNEQDCVRAAAGAASASAAASALQEAPVSSGQEAEQVGAGHAAVQKAGAHDPELPSSHAGAQSRPARASENLRPMPEHGRSVHAEPAVQSHISQEADKPRAWVPLQPEFANASPSQRPAAQQPQPCYNRDLSASMSIVDLGAVLSAAAMPADAWGAPGAARLQSSSSGRGKPWRPPAAAHKAPFSPAQVQPGTTTGARTGTTASPAAALGEAFCSSEDHAGFSAPCTGQFAAADASLMDCVAARLALSPASDAVSGTSVLLLASPCAEQVPGAGGRRMTNQLAAMLASSHEYQLTACEDNLQAGMHSQPQHCAVGPYAAPAPVRVPGSPRWAGDLTPQQSADGNWALAAGQAAATGTAAAIWASLGFAEEPELQLSPPISLTFEPPLMQRQRGRAVAEGHEAGADDLQAPDIVLQPQGDGQLGTRSHSRPQATRPPPPPVMLVADVSASGGYRHAHHVAGSAERPPWDDAAVSPVDTQSKRLSTSPRRSQRRPASATSAVWGDAASAGAARRQRSNSLTPASPIGPFQASAAVVRAGELERPRSPRRLAAAAAANTAARSKSARASAYDVARRALASAGTYWERAADRTFPELALQRLRVQPGSSSGSESESDTAVRHTVEHPVRSSAMQQEQQLSLLFAAEVSGMFRAVCTEPAYIACSGHKSACGQCGTACSGCSSVYSAQRPLPEQLTKCCPRHA
jgi:hypothetical protein